MNKSLKQFAAISLSLWCFAQSTNAALPPYAQNIRDLEVMVQFVRSHAKVADSLNSIDVRSALIRYKDDCVASFERAQIPSNAMGMPGPIPPLVFKSSTCPLQ